MARRAKNQDAPGQRDGTDVEDAGSVGPLLLLASVSGYLQKRFPAKAYREGFCGSSR